MLGATVTIDGGIVTAAGEIAVAAALGAQLIRTVNVPLMNSDEPLSVRDRSRLVRSWHRTNSVRVVLLAVAVSSLSHLARARQA